MKPGFNAAIDALSSDGLNVEAKAYGFSVLLDDGFQSHLAQCVVDNDFSISLAVQTPDAPQARICGGLKPGDDYRRVEWFFSCNSDGHGKSPHCTTQTRANSNRDKMDRRFKNYRHLVSVVRDLIGISSAIVRPTDRIIVLA